MFLGESFLVELLFLARNIVVMRVLVTLFMLLLFPC